MPNLNQDQENNLNRRTSNEEIEAVRKKPPNQKNAQDQMVLMQNLLDFLKELIPILLNVFHIIETEESLPNSFYVATVTLIPNHTNTQPRRELQTNLSHEHGCKNSQ